MIEQLEELIRDYSWMKNEVRRLEYAIYGRSYPMRSWGVAQYGIEATLPKGSPGKSQAELRDMDVREERLLKRLKRYEERVYALEMATELLATEKEKVVYDCLLDGMSFRSIAYHVGMSRNQVKKTKDEILSQLSQKSQFVQLLNVEKSAC
jgi:DNA-binding NarL/FixJ family response regulator